MRVTVAYYSFVVLLFSSLLGWHFPVLAQPTGNLETPSFQTITVNDGLTQGQINAITQDQQGFIWIGTADGLNRYNGRGFEVFKHIPDDTSSISSNDIKSLLFTKDSVLLVGTSKGRIDEFDPRHGTFKSYKIETSGSRSLELRFLMEHSSGMIWLGTNRGLFTFDRETLRTEEFVYTDSSDRDILRIHQIMEDQFGNLFLATNDPSGGLFYLDLEKKVSSQFKVSYDFTRTDYDNFSVPALLSLRNGKILIGTNNGLYEFHKRKWYDIRDKNGNVEKVPFHEFVTQIPGVVPTYKAIEDQYSNLWIGTFSQSGVQFADLESNYLANYSLQTNPGYGPNSVTVISMFEDRSGVIWLGSNGRGIFKYARSKNKFVHFLPNDQLPFQMHSKSITTILEDSKKRLWIGGYQGLDVFDLKTGESKFVGLQAEGKPSDTEFRVPRFVYEDPAEGEDIYWIGTDGGGLFRYNYRTHFVDEHYFPPSNSSSETGNRYHLTHSDRPVSMIRDRAGQLWMTSPAGLEKFDPTIRGFAKIIPADVFCPFYFKNILEPSGNSEYLWLSSAECGLFLFNKRKETFHQFEFVHEDSSTLSGSYINTLFEDRNQQLWIGTDGGVSILELKDFNYDAVDPTVGVKFKVISEKDGLPNNYIYSILEDEAGNIWMSSNKGLTRLNPISGEIKNFDTEDGLQAMEFNRHAYCKAPDGKLYFGGINGLNFFYPDRIKINQAKPEIALSGLKVLNRPYQIKDHAGKVLSINEVDTIQLSHDQNIISFEFVALEFSEPKRNQYAYHLEKFNKEWIYIGNKNEAAYTNLDPGEYTFRVKASNNDGVWNEDGRRIHLIIHPPWWKTIWARILWGVLAVLAGFGAFKVLINRVRMQEQLKLGEERVEKLQELDQVKSRFFANISHEFRTPLTLILSPVKLLKTKTKDPDTLKEYQVIEKNATRLLQLINQILNLSKLETNALVAHPVKADIIQFLRSNVAAFQSMAESREIGYTFHFQVKSLIAEFDKEHLEMIVNNILSNAFKFTPEGEEVAVRLDVCDLAGHMLSDAEVDPARIAAIRLVVTDTGIGINEENLKHIFDRFYQVDQLAVGPYQGTGIGLALVKQLVEFYHGRIIIDSREGEGTKVEILIPLAKVFPVNEPGEVETSIEDEKGITGSLSAPPAVIGPEIVASSGADEKKSVLIVEDNEDLRRHIEKILIDDYRLLDCENGKLGYETALSEIPDLIISDVMMPEMDGYEMTDLLKNHPRTCHIPILLLTAKATQADKLEGLTSGADAYLAKPFDMEELKIRLKNMIRVRESIQRRLTKDNFMELSQVDLSHLDREFLQQAIQSVENHLDEPAFSVNELANEAGMSRVHFHRKIKALTDKSTTHFIRSIRLKRAAELLRQGGGNVTEVAFMVGFNSQSYFTRCFQEEFGDSPKEFMKKT